MSKLADDFFEGLTITTRASWLGIILVTFVEFALCCVLVEPRRLAKIDRHWLMDSSHDEYADLTVRLLALRYEQVTEPHVTFLGASNSTRSLAHHDDETMSEELSNVYGNPAHFDVFSTNNQRYEDWLQIVDQFPRSYRGVLVLEMHDMKDDYRGGAARNAGLRRRLALPSTPSMTRIWKAQGVDFTETGIFFLDHFSFFAARRMVALRLAPVPTDWVSWAGGRNQQRYNELIAHFERMKLDIAAGKEAFDLNRRPTTFIRSRRVLARVVAIIKAHKSDVLMVQAPRFPPRTEVYHDRIDQFREDMYNFCEQFGCHSWDPNAEIDFEAEDFQDSVHLNNPDKRREFTDLLLQRVSNLLVEQKKGHLKAASGEADAPPKDNAPANEVDAGAREPEPGDPQGDGEAD